MFLQPFDLEGNSAREPADAKVHPEYEAGFAAGHAHAMAEVEAAQERIDAALVQALTDMEFGHSEARSLILEQLAPLIAALSEKLLPALSEISLAQHLAAEILDAVQADLAGQIIVELPDLAQSQLITGLLHAVGRDLPIRFRQNAALEPGEATIRSDRRETTFDVERTISSLQNILEAIISETAKETKDD
ncbi:hypothetical protein EU803_10215 [Loktanella sp. IMCC34160]|uniref:hypothetical protein n=1 Tax=Loktanella sp. IMCC34160 TaxID=2510646 RepID=UPI00101CB64C|nr:hypothetical protein [Loktanella sp. IMCC34160]RYG91456.1 hypothetical protein EU803_10215 [Loktanella sp. IMCC34160]